MAAVMNGIALHGGFIPYGGTFLTFSDYSRNAIRMAALMKQRVIHVFTHDSIGLGEDGPTHQSIEHAASLRLIPEPRRLAPVRHARDAGGLGRGDRPARAADARCCCRARTCRMRRSRVRPAGPTARSTRSPRAPTCSPSRPRSACAARPQAVHHRHRLGGAARAATRSSCSPAGARRHRGARRVDAVDHACSTARTAAYKRAVLPRRRAAHRGRDGRHRRLVEVRLRRGRRHRPLRRIGARPAVLFKHFGFTAGERRARHACGQRSAARSDFIAGGPTMTIKVAINGYGRIGRNVLRAALRGRQEARHPDRRASTTSASPRPTRT